MPSVGMVGFGYCARHFVAAHREELSGIVGTARTASALETLPAGAAGFVFNGHDLAPDLLEALSQVEVLLLSAPPDADGDPLLRAAGERLATGRLRQVVYLTTLGVYGDHHGAWVDEDTPPRAGGLRLQRRLDAETAWFDFGRRHGVAVAVLRLAGIYGPGRNVLLQLKTGTARVIDKPGQVFNRVHVEDIGRALEAVIARRFHGILNVTDDLPTAPGVPVAYAAQLLGLPAPVPVPFAIAARTMDPMALSFWGASKRVSNRRLKQHLGVALAYPTYRQGLDALAMAGKGR